ncbi:condensation domain-containing protein [Lentisalinibacter sediminis]|uniref:condensation domain-containing protein n=1 Tax=Lentisalinibacter sediminis TaxID=2992237 RepID=UPI003866D4F7
MITTELNLLDAAFLNIERPQDPWSIHLELQLKSRIDEECLLAAIGHAQRRHPLARARLRPYHAGSVSYSWEIGEQSDIEPLRVRQADTEQDLAELRAELLSTSVPLDVSPGFRLLLARAPDGDRLIINLNHAVADGLSAFRIMTSIVRHYAGEEDPVPDIDPLAVRDLGSLAATHSLRQRLERLGLFAEYLLRSTTAPVRINGHGAPPGDPDDAPGYGVHLLPFTAEETARFLAGRRQPATVNDMLLAGLALTIRAWNRETGGRTGKISVMMPVNLRPREWWYEVVSNFSSYVNVILDETDQRDFDSAVGAVCRQTLRLKEAGAAGTLIDVLSIPRFLPAVLKARLREIAPTVGRRHVQTSWLSNLGRLAAAPVMGDAGRVHAIYFSPPAHMPMGVSVGAVSLEDRMTLTLRYRKAVFDAAAAGEFAGRYRAILLDARH